MAPDKYIVKSIIICDDVRQEVSGKEILIGVYNDVLVLPGFPSVLPRLIFRISVSSTQKLGKFVFQVEDSKGGALFKLDGESVNPSIPQSQPVRTMMMQILQVRFDEPDAFKIKLSFDGEKLREIGEFLVRGPVSDDESRKFT